mgnify:FL=1
MRVLATIAFSFAAGLFLVLLLPWSGWYLWAAAGLALAAVGLRLWARRWRYLRRSLMVLWPLAAALAYFTVYQAVVQQPVLEMCGKENDFTATVCGWPEETGRGGRVTVRLRGLRGAKAVYYGGDEVLSLIPGQELSGTAWWQNAANIRGTALTQFTARGVYALLYQRGEGTAVSDGSSGGLQWLPLRAGRAFRRQISVLWEDPSVQGFLTAELTGDKAALPEGDAVAMQETGLAHLFAVSGLHCGFLVTLLSLLLPTRRRRTLCAVTAPVLLFYMVMVGLSPSVVRACIMQLFLLIAPLFRRDGDGLTSLAAALGVILLVNPFAAGSVSLQLSFAAALGMVLLAPRLHGALTGWYRGGSPVAGWLVRFAAANLAATLGAMVFTAPLIAWYFNIFSLVSPLAGLLAVPAAGWSFMAAFVTTLLSFAWLPLGRVLGWLSWVLVKYILLAAHGLTALPFHAVYFDNRYLIYWMLYSYAAFIGCAVTKDRRRKYAAAAVLSALALMLSVWLGSSESRGGVMSALALDVGQGESVALWSDGQAVLVDCGSSNSYVDAGGVAADRLESMGLHRLQCVIVTHYHADHTNGLYEVLERLPVDKLYLPDIEDEYGVRERLVSLAEEKGTDVVFVERTTVLTLGEMMLTVYPPVTASGDLNEQGLSVLGTAGEFDILVTGDMAGSTERRLAEIYDLPDVEVLVVSHHGSRYSSDAAFLQAIRPETAVISVGDNSYGHPAQETLDRLTEAGASVWRTDEQGAVRITVNGGN